MREGVSRLWPRMRRMRVTCFVLLRVALAPCIWRSDKCELTSQHGWGPLGFPDGVYIACICLACRIVGAISMYGRSEAHRGSP